MRQLRAFGAGRVGGNFLLEGDLRRLYSVSGHFGMAVRLVLCSGKYTRERKEVLREAQRIMLILLPNEELQRYLMGLKKITQFS